MTMKMGLERGLLEKIPDITEVVQVQPEGPVLTEEGVEEVLEEIRPFLKMVSRCVPPPLPQAARAMSYTCYPRELRPSLRPSMP